MEIRDDANDLVPKTAYQPSTSTEESHRSDDQKLQDNAQQSSVNPTVLLGSRGLISRFEKTPPSPPIATTISTSTSTTKESPTSPTSRTNRSQSQDPARKSLPSANINTSVPSPVGPASSLINGMATAATANKKDNPQDSSAVKRVRHRRLSLSPRSFSR